VLRVNLTTGETQDLRFPRDREKWDSLVAGGQLSGASIVVPGAIFAFPSPVPRNTASWAFDVDDRSETLTCYFDRCSIALVVYTSATPVFSRVNVSRPGRRVLVPRYRGA